jgi:phage baseplate assembly protein W
MTIPNLSALEESMVLNHGLLLKRIISIEERMSSVSIKEVEVDIITSSPTPIIEGKRYIVLVTEEIIRLLTTPLGSRVMRPEYGSELYKVRDRVLDGYWRLMAMKYTFEAINRWIDRVRVTKITFTPTDSISAKVRMNLTLERR